MNPYYKKFEIRWSDLDANRHVANTAYSAFMNHVRMSFLKDCGFSQESFSEFNIGPAIFSESFYYLKEVLPEETVYVDIELLGLSTSGIFAQFGHSLFKENGEQAVYSTVTFGWMNLKQRKLTIPPKNLFKVLELIPRSEKFKTLSREDTRFSNIIPQKKLGILEA